jgi:hypothetical protein
MVWQPAVLVCLVACSTLFQASSQDIIFRALASPGETDRAGRKQDFYQAATSGAAPQASCVSLACHSLPPEDRLNQVVHI